MHHPQPYTAPLGSARTCGVPVPALTPSAWLQQPPGHEDEVQVVLSVAQCQHGHAPSTQVRGVQRGQDGTKRLCVERGMRSIPVGTHWLGMREPD